jgi:hypothetical protein
MQRVVLKAILYFGRYAVLPVVALAAAMLMAWFIALDRDRFAALVTALVVLSAAPAAMALALGLLLVPRRRDTDLAVDENAAPGLWATWKALDPAFSRSGRTLRIDREFNASIGEERQFLGLFGRHLTMNIGLPLLIVLDERAIRAVIAHEVAHARLQHTSGAVNLADFITAAENVLHYADPVHTVTGRVAYFALHWLIVRLDKEYRALSRQNELEADGHAGERVGHDKMARALVLMEGAGARLIDLVFAPLDKEMLGAVRAPAPPFQRIFAQLEAIRAIEPLAAAAAARLMSESRPDQAHPPFRTRLANLGFTAIPPIDNVHTSAIDGALSAEAAKEMPARFDNEWHKKADAFVEVGA